MQGRFCAVSCSSSTTTATVRWASSSTVHSTPTSTTSCLHWGAYVNAPVCLFDGGPVAMDSALAVGVLADGLPPLGWRQMAGRVGLVDLEGPLPGDGQFAGLRVFAGYAGWGAGQLEDELLEGSWVVVDALESDLSSPTPETLWREVLRRQADDVRFWATFPPDPGIN